MANVFIFHQGTMPHVDTSVNGVSPRIPILAQWDSCAHAQHASSLHFFSALVPVPCSSEVCLHERIQGSLYVPEPAADGSPLRVVFLLHGLGSGEHSWADFLCHPESTLTPHTVYVTLSWPSHGQSETAVDPEAGRIDGASEIARQVWRSLRAYGTTDGSGYPMVIHDRAGRLVRNLPPLREKWSAVVGNSMGGGIATQLASESPELMEHLVLIDPVTPYGKRVPPLLMLIVALPTFIADAAPPYLSTLMALSQVFVDQDKLTPQRMGAYQALMRPASLVNNAIRGTFLGFQGKQHRERIATLQVPTTLIWGTGDRWLEVEQAEPFCAAMPTGVPCAVRLLEGVGHVPQEEVPGATTAIVNEIIASTAGQQ
jgi:pimeloyl-ACP methyl ester carboxylesterase